MVLPNTLRIATGPDVGGSTLAEIATLLNVDRAQVSRCILVIWAGSYLHHGGHQVGAPRGRDEGHSRLIIIPYAGSQAETIKRGMDTRRPGQVFDWRSWVADSAGIIARNRMQNYLTDSTTSTKP